MKQRKIPQRMCTGCREMKPKRELVRVVRTLQGDVLIDRTGKAAGRGAYICPDVTCLAKAKKSRALERGLEKTLDTALYEQLEREIGRWELFDKVRS